MINNTITLLLSYYRGSAKRGILPISLGREMKQTVLIAESLSSLYKLSSDWSYTVMPRERAQGRYGCRHIGCLTPPGVEGSVAAFLLGEHRWMAPEPCIFISSRGAASGNGAGRSR